MQDDNIVASDVYLERQAIINSVMGLHMMLHTLTVHAWGFHAESN